MSTDSYDIVGWAQVLATGVAGLGLILNAVSLRLSSKAMAMDWLFRFQQRLDLSIREIVDASEETREHRVRDHVNLLEVCCMALEKKVVPRAAREMVKDAVVDHLATIRAATDWHSVLESNITHPNAQKALAAFYRKHKAELDQLFEKRTAD